MIDIFKSFRKVVAAFAIQPIIFQQGSSSSGRVFQSRGVHPTTFLNTMIQGSTHYPSNETMTYLEGRVNKTQNTAQMMYQLHNFYLPMFYYLMHQRRDVLTKFAKSKLGMNKTTVFVGISAPQGCGKTTLTDYLKVLFDRAGLNCLSISLDDFYVTGAEQETLAVTHADNPLLQYRGNAGTHDLSLLMKTLHDAASATHVTQVMVPQYDKSLRNGRGDRVSLEKWLVVNGPVDVVLLEGWMAGFEPLNAEELVLLNINSENMKEINELLRSYKPIHELMDTWVVLAVESVDKNINNNDNDNSSSDSGETDELSSTRCSSSNKSDDDTDAKSTVVSTNSDAMMEQQVYTWRLQAEEVMRQSGRSALSASQVKDFVSRFMPAYSTYLPKLYRHGPQRRVSLLPLQAVDKIEQKQLNDNGRNTCDNSNNSNSQVSVLKVVVDSNRSPVTFHELEQQQQQ